METISLPLGFERLDPFPLDKTSVFATYADLSNYALTNPTAYTGQICSLEDSSDVFVITTDKSLVKINGTTGGGGGGGGTANLSDIIAFAIAL